MVLQLYRPICELVAVFRALGRVQAGIVIYGVVVVDSHAVVVNGKGRVAYEAVSVKFCGVELDVVGLPRFGLDGGVYFRRVLAVNLAAIVPRALAPE